MFTTTHIIQLLSIMLVVSDDNPPRQPTIDWTSIAPILGLVLALGGAIYGFYSGSKETKKARERISRLELKTEQEPEKVKFAWDLARVKLEAYFDRNLSQVKFIFYLAVVVMAVGFGFVLWGLRAAIADPNRVRVALIASASGVITQFIGLTFMVIYRSTMLQATQFMTVLDRINTVGMAVQILDAIDEKASELKDMTRVDIIRLLLAPAAVELSFSPRSRKKKAESKGEAASA